MNASCMSTGLDRRRGLLDDISPSASADMDAWADWIRKYRDGLGYGSTSIAWRMMQAKLLGVAARGTYIEPQMPAAIARVDSAVGDLPRHLKRAFKVYYLQYATIDDKARKCRTSVAEFYRRLRAARRTVADSLRPHGFPS